MYQGSKSRKAVEKEMRIHLVAQGFVLDGQFFSFQYLLIDGGLLPVLKKQKSVGNCDAKNSNADGPGETHT